MTKYEKVCIQSMVYMDVPDKEVSSKLDLSDFGNAIGMAIAKYFSKKPGWDKESFLSGLDHGISLTDGTHGEQ